MPRFPSPKNSPSRSPRTPVKLYDTCLSDFCLICDLSLKKGKETVYFNVKSCPDSSQVIGHVPDSTKESSRICRPCKRKIESSVKKAQAAQFSLEDIKKKYEDTSKAAKLRGCESVHVKRRLPNSSPKNCTSELKRVCSSLRKSKRLFPVESEEKFCLGENSDVEVTPIQEDSGIFEVSGVSPFCLPGLESIQSNDLGISSLFDSPNYSQRQKTATQKLSSPESLEAQATKPRVQVKINYASGVRNTEIKEPDAEVVKYIALGLKKLACKALLKHEDCKDMARYFVFQSMDNEFTLLTGNENPSMLRNSSPEGITGFELGVFASELEKRAPMVWGLLKILCTSKRKKAKAKKASKDNEDDDEKPDLAVCATTAAMLLKSRHPHMSALAYRNGLLMRFAGAGNLALQTLNRVGLCMSPNALSSKVHELGTESDKPVQEWKKEIEKDQSILHALEVFEDKASELQHLPKIPSVNDVKLYLQNKEMKSNVRDSMEVNEEIGIGTLSSQDLVSLGLSCIYKADSSIDSICKAMQDDGIEEEIIIECLNSLVIENEVSTDIILACKSTSGRLRKELPKGYQIIGDNLDLHINAKHMTTKNKNKSLHNFNMIALEDDISGNHLPDIHSRPLSAVSIPEFLPSNQDILSLKQDMIPLWSRVIVKHFSKFAFFRDSIIYHIPHQYSNEMKEKSNEVILGTLQKNENLNEDMVDILETIQENYVPWIDNEPADFIFFGGDELTEERAINIQKARIDGQDIPSRLQGVWPKFEDWHGIRIAYSAALKILNKPNSIQDWGTFASNAIASGNNNALKDVLDNFSAVKEFFNIETDSFITAATMEYFGMKTTDSLPLKHPIPPAIRKGSKLEKRQWLHAHIEKMLDLYVMDGITSDINGAVEECEDSVLPRPDLPCSFLGCPKVYKYPKCKIKHEMKVHGITFEEKPDAKESEPKCKQETKMEEETEKEDHIFNYGCLHLTLGLILRDADDAVKEGDGERLMCVWKFLTLLFRLCGNTKYALAGLRLQASRLALLTPKQAHRLTWNRFAATKYGPGQRISRDLRLEHVNRISKEQIRALGSPNINRESIQHATKATGMIEKLIQKSNKDLKIAEESGTHNNKHAIETFSVVLNQITHHGKVFQYSPGREYGAFRGLKRNLFKNLNGKSLHKWIKRHRNKWHRQNMHIYRFQ